MSVQIEQWQTATDEPVIFRVAPHPFKPEFLMVEATHSGARIEKVTIRDYWDRGEGRQNIVEQLVNPIAVKRLMDGRSQCPTCGHSEQWDVFMMDHRLEEKKRQVFDQVKAELGLPERKMGKRK